MGDDDPQATFGYVAEKRNAYDLADLHLENPNKSGAGAKVMQAMWKKYRAPSLWPMVSIARRLRPGFNKVRLTYIAFGRSFLADPDLPTRCRQRAELNADDLSTDVWWRRQRLH